VSAEHAGLGFLLCKTAHLFSGSGLAEFDQRDSYMVESPAKTAPAASKARILLVDAHPIVRRGMRHLISASGDMSVCGEAASGDEAIAKINELKPDLVVLDFSLPGKSGIDLLKEIKARRPQVQILVVSRYEENIYAQRVLRAGALGYIMQREATENILSAIRRVLGGQVYVSDSVAAGALRHFAAESRAEMRHSHEVLTDRELEIFRSIGEGKSLRDIARMLKLSVHTVAAHRGHIISKLGLSGSRELLRMAMQQASEHWQGGPGSAADFNASEGPEPTRRRNAKKR
jgi:DNA-binding NarL/FixJ family response regulator